MRESNFEPNTASGTGHSISRRQVLQSLTAAGVGSIAFQRSLAAQVDEQGKLTADMIGQAEWISGVELSDEEREEVAKSVEQIRKDAKRLRELPVDADTVPVLVFRPDFFFARAAIQGEAEPADAPESSFPPAAVLPQVNVAWSFDAAARLGSDEDLAFSSVVEQASLLAAKKISSRELTELYLKRLKKFDPLLKCVVTMLEEHALESADAADRRRKQSRTLGVLDGIPWVAKDLIAIPPWKTTWGAEPFKDQIRETQATVATKLSQAGGVLLAKVTLGAMAWGDEWFGGTTRNPWSPQQGSSGSSAGSAAAVAAGLATFALGSETLGSIVSPTTRCRTSGLRPTFGRVSRAGCMPLAWSMDKIGPIARHADDLAFVFAATLGQDQLDPTLVDRGFQWPISTPLSELKIGVTGGRLKDAEQQALDYLISEGANIVDVDLDSELPVGAMSFILGTEASTVFDDAYREDTQADFGKWPSTFRESQFTPAIQYLRANRMRGDLIVEFERKFSQVDVVIGGNDLLITNLTGHPSIVVACGTEESRDGNKVPGVVKLTAAAYQEQKLLHVARALQSALPPTPARPPLEDFLAAMHEKAHTENGAEHDN